MDDIKIEYFGDDDEDDFKSQQTGKDSFSWDSEKKSTYKNKEFQKKLIVQVGSFSILYDRSHKDNRNLQKRNEAWEKIGIILDKPTIECQKTWEKLRNCYRHYYSMEKKNRSSGDWRGIKWEFYELMSFLKPCMDYSKSKPAIGSCEQSISKSISEDEESELSSFAFNHEKEPTPAVKKQKKDKVEQLVGAISQLVDFELSKHDDSGFYKHLEHQAKIFLSPKNRLEFEAKCLNLLLEYSKK